MGKRENKISKDYDQICMCWGFYRFLIETCGNTNDTNGFIIAYGLDNQEAYNVAINEDVEILASDIDEFYK